MALLSFSTRHFKHPGLWSTLLALSFLWTPLAHADTPSCVTAIPSRDADSARQLTIYGLQCFEAQRYDWALTHYLAAYEIRPNADLRAVIGRALHELGLYEAARREYQAFLRAEDDTPAAARIRQRINELDQAIEDESGSLHLTTSPPGATTYMLLDNGSWYDLGPTPSEHILREGTYRLRVDRDDYHPITRDVTVRRGRQEAYHGDLIHESSTFDISDRRLRRAGAWTMISSVPVTATGITLLVLASQDTRAARELEDHFQDLDDYHDRRREHLDRANDLRFWGTVTTVAGATGLLAGALLFSAGTNDLNDAPDDESARLRLRPQVGAQYLGVELHF